MRSALCLIAVLGLLLVTGAVDAPLPLAQGFPAAYSYQVQLAASPYDLVWYMSNPGDYNQDGEVNISDITEVSRYFGDRHPLGQFYINDVRLQVDGDHNGEINQADLVVIASHFGNDVLGGYNVYSSSSEQDYPADFLAGNGPGAQLLGHVEISAPPTGLFRYRMDYQFKLEDPDSDAFYWVRPVNSSGKELRSSRLVQISADNLHGIGYPPYGQENAAQLHYEDDQHIIAWYYQNAGDYTQEGEVSAKDLVLIAANFGKAVLPSEMDEVYVCDGNQDGVVDYSDQLPIRRHFGSIMQGYLVEGTADPAAGPDWEWAEVSLEDSVEATGRKYFTCSMDFAPPGYYRVCPLLHEGWWSHNRGIPSNWVYVP